MAGRGSSPARGSKAATPSSIPTSSATRTGIRKLFRQFSFPGGIPSHVAPETPGSIHEGGELGYALAHAYGAALDNPDLLVACVIGDGEAETGPLAASWHSNKFLNPARDGAVLPILHLNGYKIANPTVLSRITHEELDALMRGYGHQPWFVEGDEPEAVHQALAAALDEIVAAIRRIQDDARSGNLSARAGRCSCCARRRAGRAARGHAELAPGSALRPRDAHGSRAAARGVDAVLPPRGALRRAGHPRPEVVALAPAGERRMGANPHANGGLLLHDLRLPDFRDYAVDVAAPGPDLERGDTRARDLAARRRHGEHGPLPRLRPGRDGLEPARRGRGGHGPRLDGGDQAGRRPHGARRARDGGPQRAPVPGLARGLSADRPARPLQLLRGLHPHRRLDVQPAREVAQDHAPHPVAPADRVAELPAELARLAPGPQRVLPPGPGLHRPRGQQEGRDHPRLPAAGRQLPALGRRPLPAQPPLRQRDRGRQATGARLPRHGRGDRALHPRHRHLGLGVLGRRRRTGRRARVRRRHADARDRRRRGAAAPAPARAEGAGGQRRRPDAPAGRDRAPARPLATSSSTPSSPPTSR